MAASARDKGEMQQASPRASMPSTPDINRGGFQNFPNLPAELRLIVWKNAIDEPLLVICGSSHSSDCIPTMAQTTTALGRVTCWHERRSVALLNTCRESRAAVCTGYPLWTAGFKPTEASQPFWNPLRPAVDTILCADDSVLPTVLEQGFRHLAFKTPYIINYDIDETTGVSWKAHWTIIACYQHYLICDMIKGLGYNVAALGSCTMVVTEAMRRHDPSLGDGPFPFSHTLCPLEKPDEHSTLLYSLMWQRCSRGHHTRYFAGGTRIFIAYGKAD